MLNSRNIALGGILAAVTLVFLYLSSILPTSKFFILAITSFMVAIIIIEGNLKRGFIFYVVTSVLSLILVPDKSIAITYVLFFGFYGIIKSYIEQTSKYKYLEIIIKLIFFNIDIFVIYYIINHFLNTKVAIKSYPIIGFFIAIQVGFLLYDYVFSIVISYYYKNIKNKVR